MDNKVLEYCALDGACTFEIRNAIWDDIAKQGYLPTYKMTIDVFEPLLFMMTRGIKVDAAEMEHTKRDIQQKIKDSQDDLNKRVGRELNPFSPKQVQAYFYLEKGVEPYVGKDGRITCDDKALQRIARGTAKRAGMREASLIQTIRGLNKLYSSYLDINFDTDGRLRCAYNPRGTKFGRLSSSETVFGTGTNQQNLPSVFKRFLVSDDGYFFLEVDKRQAEWVVVAAISGDANMLEVIRTGADPHTHTAGLMFNIPADIIVREHKLIGTLSDPDEITDRRSSDAVIQSIARILPRTMSARQAGKKANHGLNYDEGPDMFALSNEIEIREAKRLIDSYHAVYPGIRNSFHEGVRNQLAKDRTLTNCFGRKVHFLGNWGSDLFKSAYSMLPQSTVVDSLNQGMRLSYFDDTLTKRLNADILAQVHDSILFQFPITLLKQLDKLHSAVERIFDYVSPQMEYHGRTFKIPTDVKVGYNWGLYGDDNKRGMQEIKPWQNKQQFIKSITGALCGKGIK